MKTRDFYFDLYEKGLSPPFYSKIAYAHNGQTLAGLGKDQMDTIEDHNAFFVKHVPDYLALHLRPGYVAIPFHQYKGYAITMGVCDTIGRFLDENYRTKFRTAVKRSVSRLESCFNITYKMHFGYIDEQNYQMLMATLQGMLKKRFDQIGEVNARLREWDKFNSALFPLINTKRASLFVIYNNGIPINISLNYHLEHLFFNGISSYDIDYSKFGMGHIDVYKQIEWCIQNQYQIFDMSFGDMDYKEKWSTLVYNFEHHLIYYKKSIRSLLAIQWTAFRIKVKKYFKSKNSYRYYKSVIAFLDDLKANPKIEETMGFETNLITETTGYFSGELTFLKVDYTLEPYVFLRKTVFDYLYNSTEHERDIEVLEIETGKTFVIKGKKGSIKISRTT